MLRRAQYRFCNAAAGGAGAEFRYLDAQSLLQAIHEDSGETAKYYAVRYFGPGTIRKVETLLWSDLKKNGHVDVERDAELEKPARWFPVQSYARKAPVVRRYRQDDYDLSYLAHEDKFDAYRTAKQQESDLVNRLRAAGMASGGRGGGWSAWKNTEHPHPQNYYTRQVWGARGFKGSRRGGGAGRGGGNWGDAGGGDTAAAAGGWGAAAAGWGAPTGAPQPPGGWSTTATPASGW